MDLEKLRILIEANTGGSVKELNNLNRMLKAQAQFMRAAAAETRLEEKALKDAAKAAKDKEKASGSLGASIYDLTKKYFFFSSALDRVRAGFRAVMKEAEDAARNQTAKMYFEDAGKSLEQLRKVSKGMVSDSDLVKKANLADSMGLSEDTFARLITVAQAASAKTGQTFDHMFDSIVLGTARSSRLLLDNLGIIVKLEDAYKHYAEEAVKRGEAQGMTVKQVVNAMSDEAKKLAFIEELHRKTNGQVAQLEKLGGGGAAVFDRWAASVDNLKQALMESLLPALQTVLAWLTDVVNSIRGAVSAKTIAQRVGGMGTSVTDQNNLPIGRNIHGKLLATSQYGSDYETADNARAMLQDAMAEAVKASGLAADDLLDASGKVSKQAYALANTFLADNRAFAQNLGIINDLNPVLREYTKKAAAAARPSLFGEGGEGGGGGAGGKRFLITDYRWNEIVAQMEQEADMRKDAMTAAKKSYADWQKDSDELVTKAHDAWFKLATAPRDILKDAMTSKGGAALSAGDSEAWAEKVGIAIAKAELAEWKDSRLAAGVGVADQIVSGVQGGQVSALTALAGTAIGTAVGSPQAGGAIGELVGKLIEPLSGVATLMESLQTGLMLLIENAVGPLFDALAPLGPALGDLMKAVGVLIGAALEPLLPIIELAAKTLSLVIIGFAGLIEVLSPFIELLVMSQVFFLSPLIDVLSDAVGGFRAFETQIWLVTSALNDFMRGLTRGWWGSGGFSGSGPGTRSTTGGLPSMGQSGGFNPYNTQDIVDMVEAQKAWDNADQDLKAIPWEEYQDSLKENTRALRDLAREFHNLPSGYKGARTVYNSIDEEGTRQLPMRSLSGKGEAFMHMRGMARGNNPYR